ncbi:hypothetical protein [Campylobacter sp. CCS1377]|uniref:Uncharacterized protein n=1 Tax=Campylobacter sp. CCS1377 TaxID=3158229 RepID=A0AAU7E805_9BACT|nr:hypothetical protein [Campylobacter jejuni]
MGLINSTLPIHIKVLEKSGYNNYTLLLNHKKIQTKSLIDLDEQSEYLAELYTTKEGILQFKNLYKKPEISYFAQGLDLIVRLLEYDLDFKNYILEQLINCNEKQDFLVYKEMLFASLEGIYHIPFIYEDKKCLFQLKFNEEKCELYLYFSVFGALKIIFNEQNMQIFSPFAKVQIFLSQYLEKEVIQEQKINALFVFKKLLDFKG